MKGRIFLFLCFFSSFSLDAAPHFYAPAKASQGALVQVLIWDKTDPGDVYVELWSQKGQLLIHQRSFDLDKDWTSSFLKTAIIPIDMGFKAQIARLKVIDSQGAVLTEQNIQLESRKFESEDISLDAKMSKLRAEPGALQKSQAEAIWRIYLSWNVLGPKQYGHFSYPLSPLPEISSSFGYQRRYLYSDGTSAQDVHTGIDLACEENTPVHVSGNGIVVLSQQRELTGGTIVVQHFPGFFSVYFHMNRLDVKPGDSVSMGQIIGLSGATGFVTGPHLHWEFRCQGVSIDGFQMVKQGLLDKEACKAIIQAID